MAGGFVFNTRRFQVQLADITKPSGGGLTLVNIPRVGLLSAIYLAIRGSIAGTLTNLNPLGKACVVNNVRLTVNAGTDVFNISGAGYHYLLREALDSEYIDIVSQSDARTAVATGPFNLDMIIPVAVNPRDSIGLILLQNEQTQLTLQIDWLADSSVATGATVTATATPYLELFTVPADVQDLPRLDLLHQILEDKQTIPAAGDYTYEIPRANVYLQLLHGVGLSAAGTTDLWSSYKLRVNQAQYLFSADPKFWDMEVRRWRGRARIPSTIPVDLMAPSGLGNYGVARDLFNSALVTDVSSVITATQGATLTTVRRQIVPLAAPGRPTA